MVSVGAALFAGIFVLVGAAMVVLGVVRLRRWWTMRRMDPHDGLTVETGLQEFEGRAHAVGQTITSPYGGAESLICTHKVERYSHGGEGSNWRRVDGDDWAVPFELRGESGRTVAVNPGNANHLLTEELHVDTREDESLPPRVQSYIDEELGEIDASFDVGPVSLGGDKRYRFTEKRLDDGEEVYVLGPVRPASGAVPTSEARYEIAPEDRGWRDTLFGTPFVVADVGEDRARKRQFKRGLGLIGFGVVFGGIPLLVLLA